MPRPTSDLAGLLAGRGAVIPALPSRPAPPPRRPRPRPRSLGQCTRLPSSALVPPSTIGDPGAKARELANIIIDNVGAIAARGEERSGDEGERGLQDGCHRRAGRGELRRPRRLRTEVFDRRWLRGLEVGLVVSEQFAGKRALQRHRLVNGALKEELEEIHALSIKKTYTPEEFEAKK